MNMQRNRLTILLAAILTLAGALTHASPNLMSYQGRLSDAAGEPVADGPYNVTFRIYDDALSGAVLWAELQSVTTLDGLFATQLGKTTPLAESVFSEDARWIGVQIDTDPELMPRARLTTAPYSHRVSTVDGASAGTVTGDLTVDGEVNIIGPGVRFPDGTLQSSAASTFDPFENIFNLFTSFTSTGAPISHNAFTATPTSNIYLTKIFIDNTSGLASPKRLTFKRGTETILHIIIGQNSNTEWSSDGGAPLHIRPNETLSIEDVGVPSGTIFRFSFAGYEL